MSFIKPNSRHKTRIVHKNVFINAIMKETGNPK